MLLKENRQSFSHLSLARGVFSAALALMLLTVSAQGEGPDRLGARDDWNAMPCEMQRIDDPEGVPDANFGQTMDAYGDVFVAYGNEHVHVFRWDGAEWQHEAMLSPEDGGWLPFGSKVGVAGDFVVVGSYMDSTFGDDAGAAYVFRRDGNEWVQDAKLFASDPHDDHEFGYAVAMDGDAIVIGGHDYRFSEHIGPGSAYVFRRVGDTWIEEAKLVASDGQMDDRFGSRVTIQDDTILVRAHEAKAMYAFERIDGVWLEQQKLLPPDGYVYYGFGSAALDGDRLLLGRTADNDLGDYAGAAYIYQRVDHTWAFRQKLLAHDGDEFHSFGWGLAIQNDTLLVGAIGYHPGQPGWPVSAWAYLFRLVDDQWTEYGKLSGYGLESDFSANMALLGDRALISADESGGGAVYAFGGLLGGDCNDNGIADYCDIFTGYSNDVNENGIPDECECPADFTGDGWINTSDLLYLLSGWGTPDCDLDGDGDTDTADLLLLLAAWGPCPP
jgi:hypothetical protein